MTCYFSKNYKGFNAGNKAKTDIERIMDGLGFRNIGCKQTHHKNKFKAYFVTLSSVLKATSGINTGDVLVLQYPLKKYYKYVCEKAHKRGAKVVTVIHDLGSFRRKKLTVAQEIELLDNSDYVIASNESMKKWLADNGCKTKLGSLDVFDYLSETSPVDKPVGAEPRIIYAGKLTYNKNQFLYDTENYINGYQFILYGGGFEEEKIKRKDRFIYKGFTPSDDLIEQADGEYGLVWDGPSVDTCSGDFGEYLRYNSPHKMSLYLRCELPIVIWEKAALADFVKANKVGLCVGSLKDLGDTLAKVTPEEYAEMKANARKIGKQLSEGYYFSKAVNKAIKELAE